jgi:biotin carboxyl carrier protein
MTFEIEIAGRVRRVSVQPIDGAGPAGGRFRLIIRDSDESAGGESLEVDARATDLGLSLVYADGRSVDAAVTGRPAGELFLQLPHVDLSAIVDGRRSHRADADAGGGSGAQRIVAPMPGRIVRVLVHPGDHVAARQGLVVIEAMKMENELTAVRPGRVTEVAVTAGSSVESGRLLVVIE